MYLYRTFTERVYITNLNAITAATLESWLCTSGIDRAAWCWPKPLLVAEFRYLRKTNRYWTVWVQNERRLRSKNGRVIPRHFSRRSGFVMPSSLAGFRR